MDVDCICWAGEIVLFFSSGDDVKSVNYWVQELVVDFIVSFEGERAWTPCFMYGIRLSMGVMRRF